METIANRTTPETTTETKNTTCNRLSSSGSVLDYFTSTPTTKAANIAKKALASRTTQKTLTMYRRHTKACGKTEPTLLPNDAASRKADTCSCPINVHGYLEHHQGRIRHYSLETSDWIVADQRRLVLIRNGRLNNTQSSIVTGDVTVAYAVDAYLNARSGKIEAKSLRMYETSLRLRLIPFCEKHNIVYLKEFENFHVVELFEQSWVNLKTGEPLDGETHNQQISHLRTFLKYCVAKQKWIKTNEALQLELDPTEDEDDGEKVGLELHEFENVLKTLESYPANLETKRLRAIVLLMRWTGMRISDATKFCDKELVQTTDGYEANFVQQKIGKRCIVSVDQDAIDALKELPFVQEIDGKKFWFLLPIAVPDRHWRFEITKLFKATQERFGKFAHHATPHTLRHTAAILWLNAGMDIRDVSHNLGHQNLMTTIKHYSHNNASAEKQRREQSRAASITMKAKIDALRMAS
jgi:site-specific recombinase XerD